MKKLGNLSLLAFLAVGFALVFGGCKSGVGGIIAAVEAMDQGDSGPSGGDGDTENPDDDVNEVIVFDPATYTGNAGNVVDGKDGAKYLEITPNGWVTDFGIPEVDITGKTTVKCMVYAKDEKDDVQIVVKLMNAKGQGFALPTLRPVTDAPAEAEGPILSRADRWDNDTNSNVTEDVTDFKCVRLNPFIQETAGDWNALSDVTIYIGKITAVGNGGPTGPGSGDSENPSGPGDDTTGSGSGNDSGNTDNPGDSGSSGGQTGGDITGPGGEDTENPSEPGEDTENPDDDVKEIITIFDPATYTGNAGELVEEYGATYLKITPNGWNEFIEIPEVDLSGKTTVKFMVYAEEAKNDVQAVVKLQNAAGHGFALPTFGPIIAEPAEAKGSILSRADRWDSDSQKNVTEDVTDFKCVRLNPYTQKMADDWPAQTDVTIYIGKITVE